MPLVDCTIVHAIYRLYKPYVDCTCHMYIVQAINIYSIHFLRLEAWLNQQGIKHSLMVKDVQRLVEDNDYEIIDY